MKGIILKKKLKNEFDANGPQGEMVYASDTKEVGIRTTDGSIIWTKWEVHQNQLLAIDGESNPMIGGKVIKTGNGIKEYEITEDGEREILWGLTQGQSDNLLEPDYHNQTEFPFVGEFVNEMVSGYDATTDNSILIKGSLERLSEGKIKLNGSTIIDPDYSTSTDQILTLKWLNENVWKLPTKNPGEDILWNNDGVIEIGIYITFKMYVTSSTAPTFSVDGGTIQVTDNGDGTYTCESTDNITHFQFTQTSARKIEVIKFPESLTSLENTFQGLGIMRSFKCPFEATENVTTLKSAWDGCHMITSFPLIDTSSVTNFYGAWTQCTALYSFPLIDTSSGTDFSFTWVTCITLTSFPILDFSNAEFFHYTWSGSYRLTSFPILDLSSAQWFRGAWQDCRGLTSFPELDVSNGYWFVETWQGCSGLTSFPSLDVSQGTNFGGAWRNCTSLPSCPGTDGTVTIPQGASTSSMCDGI